MGRLGRGRRDSEEGAGCTEERSPQEVFEKTKRWELSGGRWATPLECGWTRASPGGSAKQSQLRVWGRGAGGAAPFLPLKRGGSFEPQSISSAPRRRRPICPGAESCKGKHVVQRLQGPGAGDQPEPPAPRSPPRPFGSFSRLASAPPRAPGGGEGQSAGRKDR